MNKQKKQKVKKRLDKQKDGILNIIRRNYRGGFLPMIPEDILNILKRSIHSVCKNISCYCNDPVSNFTRKRKLPAETLINFILQMQVKSLNAELCDYFDDIESLPTASALCQQRNKLSISAFQRITDLFVNSFQDYKTWNGYHILACDGSDVNIAYDENDSETTRMNGEKKPFSQFHINAFYDCINHIFWDINIDTATKTRECNAMAEMILRHRYPSNSIIAADRGFEKYDLIACCIENDQKFLIRTKDIHAYSSILSNMNLPDKEFDLDVRKILTKKQTNMTKTDKELYTYITNKSEFSYFDEEGFYEMNLRVVRFKITEDTYECLITNLSREEFSMEDLKKMYHMRWGIETSFKVLKYTIGMMSFHSKKRQFIQQEIYAAIILHNLSNIIVQRTKIAVPKNSKYEWQVNFSTAVTNIRKWLRGHISSEELEKRIKKYLAPVRPDRKYKRNMKHKSVIPFNNKAS